MQTWWMLLTCHLVACGRAGFDPIEAPDAAGLVASSSDDDDACADVDLGSALGEVASGTTAGGRDRSRACGGDGNEVAHRWTAPSTGRFRIDTCKSDPLWDASLYVLDGACTGDLLACGEHTCDNLTGFHAVVLLDAVEDQQVVIVVDAAAPTWDGAYRLAIQKL